MVLVWLVVIVRMLTVVSSVVLFYVISLRLEVFSISGVIVGVFVFNSSGAVAV